MDDDGGNCDGEHDRGVEAEVNAPPVFQFAGYVLDFVAISFENSAVGYLGFSS